MWKTLFPDKLVRYMDLPQDFDRRRGGAFLRRELEELTGALTDRGAKPLNDDAIRHSIAVYNENRGLVRELCELRCREPWTVPTSEFYLILRAGLVLPVEEHTRMLRDYRSEIERQHDRKPLDHARVLVTGCFCEQPPLDLIKTIEQAGCYIVDEDLVQIHRWIQRDIPVDGDPLENCIVAFLEDSIESPTRYIDEGKKGKELVQRVRHSGAEGVMFCAASFCDPALLDQPMTVAAVDAAGIPWTAFKYSENTGQFQVIREQAGTFSDSIRLWSEV
jgi:benzoyl-CoA reductase subunit C